MRPPTARSGTVLALAVLVLVSLQLLAHGALLLAQAEWASSRAGLQLLQARAGAEAAVLAAQEGATEAWDSVDVFQSAPAVTGSLAGLHPFRGRAQRLTREYWLLEGRGRARGERWAVTARYLAWRLDPLGRVAAARGAAEVGGALPALEGVDRDPERPAFCRPWQAELDSLTEPERWGRAVGGATSPEGEPSLGRLGPARLSSVLPTLGATHGTPAPALRLGRCDSEAPWNWGDPSRPGAPCGDRLVSWFVSGDLRLEGGSGQGILAVGGSLELVGTRFDGVVLAGGSVALRDGAEVRGLVRVEGDLDVAVGSRLLGSPCRAMRVLVSLQPRLARPVRVLEAGELE